MKITKEYLQEEYDKGINIKDIAKDFNLGAEGMRYYFIKFDIKVLGSTKHSPIITKKELYNRYNIKKTPLNIIAKELDVSKITLYNYIKMYNLSFEGRLTKVSDITRMKISDTKKKQHKLGTLFSQTHKSNISKSLYGRKMSNDTKEKLRIASIKQRHRARHIIDTLPERMFESKLKENNINYIKQFPYKYGIADFYLPDYNAMIEVDGNYWHNYPTGLDKDKRNTEYLKSNGYNVYRFWESDIKQNIDGCLTSLVKPLSN